MERGRFNYILNECRNKKVLHVGCVDEGLTDERLASGNLFHSQLCEVASVCDGIDKSGKGLEKLWGAGFIWLIEADIEKDEITKGPYDVVVVPEVLEHLSNPGLALDNIRKIDAEKYIFSVPAARFRFSEHSDHNFYFTEKSIRALLEKHRYEISDLREYRFKRIQPWADGYLITTI